ncbi:MAG: AI-2E family transporter [Lachnospiraceae bacterium]|nr:AI-2E family transporter [Lachnospiraceae bacterium]
MGVTAFLTFCSCILVFFFMYRNKQFSEAFDKLLKAAEPIIIGLVLAYLLIPVQKFLDVPIKNYLINKSKVKEEKAKKIAKTLSITGAIVFLFIVIALLIAIIVPALTTSVMGLIDAMPGYVESFVAWIKESRLGDSDAAYIISEVITTMTVTLEKWATNELLPEAQRYIGQITSGVFSFIKTILNFIIGIIVAVYVMSIKETLVGQAKKLVYAFFSVNKGNRIIRTVRKSNEIFGGFIIGKIVDSAIIGVIAYFGCLILKMPSTILIAVIIGVTNVIPFFGPFIGAIPAILLVLIQSPIHAVYLAIFILVLQQVDGNIIGPKILGDTTGLSSFWVLFAILIAGGIFGFLGMLLGVPVFAVIYYILQENIAYRMKKRKLPNETEKYVHLVAIDDNNELKYEKENTNIKKLDKEDKK